MIMRNLLWQSEAWKEYESLQAEKATLKKVNKLLKDIMWNGYESSYGWLTPQGCWSPLS